MCSVYLFFMQTTGKNPFGCWGYAEKNQKNCGYFKKNFSWILSYWIKNRRKHVYIFKNFSLILSHCGKTSYNIYPLNKFVSVQYSILDYMYNVVLHIPGIYLPCSVEIDVH